MALLNWSASNNFIIYRNRCYLKWKQIILYTGKKIKASNTVEIFRMTILRLREERNKKTSGLLIWAQFFNVFQMVFIVDIFYISFDSSLGVCANTHTHTHTHTHKHTHTHTHTQTSVMFKSRRQYWGISFFQITVNCDLICPEKGNGIAHLRSVLWK